jgi:hypothetical protein
VQAAIRLAEDPILGLGDESLANEIRKKYPTPMGASGGPVIDLDYLSAGGSIEYKIAFNGKEPARIWVSAAGLTDLRVYVTDEKGVEVAKSESLLQPYVEWVPKSSGYFRILIANKAKEGVDYTFITN